ncbi:MAG: DUF4276 family protein [Acidobacteria bacterium]|nr:DUF4276 family protein [Acidobacteriota bacterium]
MASIVAIVEGHGEEEAVPILLRRIAEAVAPTADIEILPPIRVERNRVVRPEELERVVELAARMVGTDGSILVLLDADDDCPAELGPGLLARARAARPDRAIRVVLAKAEYEAWFLAATVSIAGRHDIAEDAGPPDNPEGIRNAKGWLSGQMPVGRSYKPTRHQAALTDHFDLDAARRSAPSFDKLWRDVGALLATDTP